MRGVYTASYRIDGLAGQGGGKTLMHLTAPANKVDEILGVEVTNANVETNEQVELVLKRISSLGTPTDTDLTPAPHEAGDQAAGSSVAADVTADEPTYVAANVGEFGRRGVSTLAGWEWKPTPEERCYVGGGASIGLKMLNTDHAAFNAVVTMTFREIG